MPSLDKRVTKLEDAVSIHLMESGEIRTTLKEVKTALDNMKDIPADNKWLKKLMWFVLGSPFLLEGIKHIHTAVGK